MAQPITQFAVVEVAKPNIGEKRPSRVRADVTINLSVRKEIKSEWENLRKHDVCFLITVKPPNPIGNFYLKKKSINFKQENNFFFFCYRHKVQSQVAVRAASRPDDGSRLRGRGYAGLERTCDRGWPGATSNAAR